MKRLTPTLFVLLLSASLGWARNPVEVGTVDWLRDFEKAQAEARKSGKPILALFQEVPGCAGCMQFGREVLTHRQLVRSIESEFVPVVIFNNRAGNDAALLKRFGEPARNYQVIRFFDAEASDVIPRKDRVWTLQPLAARMVEALETAKRPVSKELRKLAQTR